MADCSRAAHPLAKLLSKPELLSHGGARAGVGERLPALERAPRPARRVLVLERQPFLHTSNQRGRLLHCRAGVGRRWAAEGEAARWGRTAQVGGWQPAVPAARYRLSTARQCQLPEGRPAGKGAVLARHLSPPPVPATNHPRRYGLPAPARARCSAAAPTALRTEWQAEGERAPPTLARSNSACSCSSRSWSSSSSPAASALRFSAWVGTGARGRQPQLAQQAARAPSQPALPSAWAALPHRGFGASKLRAS